MLGPIIYSLSAVFTSLWGQNFHTRLYVYTDLMRGSDTPFDDFCYFNLGFH